MAYDDVLTRNADGELEVRVTQAVEKQNVSNNYDDVFTITTDGKRALRVVGAGGGGGGAVSSVNGQTGAVVLTGAEINATLTDGDATETATVTQHLQTLKNNDAANGDAIQEIQDLIPEDASTTNKLATQSDLTSVIIRRW